jgi:hypothetical protein
MTFKNTIKENNQYPMITKTTIKKKNVSVYSVY